MVDVTSKFPDSVDELNYHSDVNIAQKDVMDQYEKYIQAHNYSQAYALIKNSNIFGWFADYFNMLENRIYSTQEYLLSTGRNNHPDQVMFEYEEPEQFVDQNKTRDLKVGDRWVSQQ